MISTSSTAPSLTSDLRSNAGEHYYAGYYRTARNDLHQGQAVAEFAYDGLDLRRMATVDDCDPYTSGLARAFAAAFDQGDGRVTIATVSKG